MFHACFGEHGRNALRLFHACRSDQDRLSGLVALGNVVGHLTELCLFVAVNQIRIVFTNHGLIRGDGDDTECVGAHEFGGFGLGRSGHTGQFFIQPEIVLQGDRGQCLVLGLNGHTLFGFNGLVDALVIPAPSENTAGVLIDNQHFAVDHDVVLVAFKQRAGLNGVVEEANQRGVC